MKRLWISGFAVAICFGSASLASAQYGEFQYSSYGRQVQESAPAAIQDPAAPQMPADNSLSPTYDVQAPTGQNHQPTLPSDFSSPSQYGDTTSQYGSTSGAMNTPMTSAGCGCSTMGSAGGCDATGAGCADTSLASFDRIGRNYLSSDDRNYVAGVRGLVFSRDYEDDLGLSQNGAAQYLFSTDADLDYFGGFETFFGVRKCNGWGWQASYFGLFPSGADVTFNGPGLSTALRGLANLNYAPTAQDVAFIYDGADNHRLYRENEIHNLEWNLLRNGGAFQGYNCNAVNIEWMAGVRWFRFHEEMRYAAFSTNPVYPPQMFYDLETQNDLIGFQLGARTEHCLTNRLSLALGTKFGIYGNEIYHRQSIHDGAGTFATINAGPATGNDYNYTSRKRDVSFLGELDLGLNYQFSSCWRANMGYRAIAATGIALAPDQVPVNFTDTSAINRINSNGSLILHGAYFGVERCF